MHPTKTLRGWFTAGTTAVLLLGGVIIAAPAGAIPATCNGKTVTIVAVADTPTVGGAGDDVILGTSGNDYIDAGLGADTICAGAGNDKVIAGGGGDTVYGDEGDDTVYGGPGADTLNGNAGRDLLFGQAGNDALFGQADNDTLLGGDNTDSAGGNNAVDVCEAESELSCETDPVPVTIAVQDTQGGECCPGAAALNVFLDHPVPQIVAVRFSTADGTATAADDYEATTGIARFEPGQTIATEFILTKTDAVCDADEFFFANLFEPAGGTLGNTQSKITIFDDDCP